MKYSIIMKTPDALSDSIDRGLDQHFFARGIQSPYNFMSEEQQEEWNNMRDNAMKAAEKFFHYHECITIELDTDKQTAIVCPK